MVSQVCVSYQFCLEIGFNSSEIKFNKQKRVKNMKNKLRK